MQELVQWVIHWAHTSNAVWALFWLAFAESSFFPIPPDVLLIAMGVLMPPKACWYATVCMVGSVTGGMFGYWIGLKAGRPVVKRFIKPALLDKAEHLYQKYDMWAVGIAGFTPIPYKVFTIAAGMCRLHFGKFVLISLLSRGARFFLVGGAIMAFGPTIEHYLEKYLNVISVAFVVLLIGGFVLVKWWAQSHHAADTETSAVPPPARDA